MIQSKQDLKNYLQLDLGSYETVWEYAWKVIKLWLRGTEGICSYRMIYTLRQYEYYFNQSQHSTLSLLPYYFWRFRLRRLELKYDMYVGSANTFGPGLKLMHPGYRFIHGGQIGANCTILPMVLIGKKKPHTNAKIVIGDNCYISTGVTILTPVRIGNNVTIGAGTVVTKDIPDNCVVAGVPAKIISINETL